MVIQVIAGRFNVTTRWLVPDNWVGILYIVCMPTRYKAYTLIEILVGLTIIGIIFGFGYVAFRDFARRQTVSGAGKELMGDLRLAQQQALSGIKPDDQKCNSPQNLTGISFQVVSSQSYTIEALCSGGNVEIKSKNIEPGLTISVPSPNPITFKILGQGTNIPSGSSAVVTVTQQNTSNTATITITSGGEIQ